MRESIRKTRKKEAPGQENARKTEAAPLPNSALESILAGRARADSKMLGHRQDLAPSLQEKMNRAFGMDLSGVQVYRSETMTRQGTKGMASGNKIVLSGDVDLNTMAGQSVLGHELSHVRAQSLGIGMGHSGLYENTSLEQQADTQGMLAARGQSIFGESLGMETGAGMGSIGGLTPLGAGMSASAGAPMQAKDKKKKKEKEKAQRKLGANADDYFAGPQATEEDPLTEQEIEEATDPESVIGKVQWKNGADDQTFEQYSKASSDFTTTSSWATDYLESHKGGEKGKRWQQILDEASEKSDNRRRYERSQELLGNQVVKKPKYQSRLGGAEKNRLVLELVNFEGASDDIFKNMASTDPKKNLLAKKRIKELHYQELLRKEKKWGKLLQQMDIDDLVSRGGAGGFAADISLGLQMGDVNEKEGGYKFGDERDQRYEELDRYFRTFENYMMASQMTEKSHLPPELIAVMKKTNKDNFLNAQRNNGHDVIQKGPSLNKIQLEEYKRRKKK